MSKISSAKVSKTHSYDSSKLLAYVQSNNLTAVSCLLEQGSPLINQLYSNLPLLEHSARRGHDKMVELLIERGALVDNCNKQGYSAIWEAVRRGHFNVVAILQQKGASLKGRIQEEELSLIELAILHGWYQIAAYLKLFVSRRENSFTNKSGAQYRVLARKYLLRYVDYEAVLEGLKLDKEESKLGQYLTKPKEIRCQEEDVSSCWSWCCFGFWTPKKAGRTQSTDCNNPESSRRFSEKNT